MYRDIAVYLSGSEEDATRLAHAAGIARSFDAHLTGLQVHQLPEVLALTDPAGSTFLSELFEQSQERAKATGARLAEAMQRTGLAHELRRFDLYPGAIGSALARESRLSDVFVATRPYGDATRQHALEEGVLFESGRPCLFVPPGCPAPESYASVLLAWKNTREAARALAGALPLLRQARLVTVAIVAEGIASEQLGEAPDEDIGRYLSRHGVAAEIRMVEGWTDVPAALLNEASRAAADLIVMGAYGHSRLLQWALGGATRHLLRHAPMPVLVAH